MQNKYTGDVGDFAKYGLMRQFGEAGFRMVLAWYLFPNEGHNAGDRLALTACPFLLRLG
jgi:hypothetical protein